MPGLFETVISQQKDQQQQKLQFLKTPHLPDDFTGGDVSSGKLFYFLHELNENIPHLYAL